MIQLLDAPKVSHCEAICNEENTTWIGCSLSYEPLNREIEVLGFEVYWTNMNDSNCESRSGCHPSTWHLERLVNGPFIFIRLVCMVILFSTFLSPCSYTKTKKSICDDLPYFKIFCIYAP